MCVFLRRTEGQSGATCPDEVTRPAAERLHRHPGDASAAPLRVSGATMMMMSLIDLDDEQRWVPTHVNVTVLRARGLRTKGKHGSRYLYTVIQLAKDKFTTGLVEKADVPEWSEECCFELLPGILEDGGRGAYPPGSGDLVLTVMHRVLIGLDVFLGQTVVPLDKIFHDGTCPRDE